MGDREDPVLGATSNLQRRNVLMPAIFLLLLTFPSIYSEYIYIKTTYQAEDAGINLETNSQCAAWKLWRKRNELRVELNSEDIDILATRRNVVYVTTKADADKYGVPDDLLSNDTTVSIDFSKVCAFYPRILKISTMRGAKKHRIYTKFCDEIADLADETIVPTTEILLNNTEELRKYTSNTDLLQLHQSVLLVPESICNATLSGIHDIVQEYEEQYGQLMFDYQLLGVPLPSLVDERQDLYKLDNYENLFEKLNSENVRPLPATQILPWLKKVKYDSRTPPSLFADDVVTVKMGLLIQSIGSFELSTMDYDMDVWIRMAWRDPRLRHGYSRPILVNDYTFLKRLWRPDPVFINTKEATFHQVSYLNFYMLIFPGGEVFYDLRVLLNPTASQIVLCKYPHDSPATSLKISSFGMSQDSVRFEWFSKKAIQVIRDVQIVNLVLNKVEPGTCDGLRKSGNYSCIEARLFLRREFGYHLAHTYIPTAICVLFSMVSVWLPEEFVEGRIFVALTVFLTLSAESNAAKEELPKVSYVKAIDIWFGFTSMFVFVTMLQAIFIIGLEYKSKKLKIKCDEETEYYGPYKVETMMQSSRFLHKASRRFDNLCKVMYPVIFLLFLIYYFFVIIQGAEDKCL